MKLDHLSKILAQPVQADPAKTAVVFRDRSLTYGELDQLSSQFASYLAEIGVQRGDRVGILLDKSIEMIVAVVGILKTGAAYVPFPASSPSSRVAWLSRDCEIKALVTSKRRFTPLDQDELPSIAIILVDHTEPGADSGKSVADWSAIEQASAAFAPLDNPDPEDLAYILYTSGSTGNPKGVMISHRAALNFVNWAAGCFGVSSADRVSNHAPLQFDLSTFDIFAALKEGATLVLVPESLSMFPVTLSKFIAEQEISVWYSVPSVLVGLVLYGKLDTYAFPALRTILFAGEVFPLQHLQALMKLVPEAEFHNLYGPTETNVCTWHAVTAIPDEVLPIGIPCAGHEIAISEDGELLVAGDSLMHGYWNLPEQSAACFTERDGVRYYRTGDRVSQNPDGSLAFLGRLDNMIKSRGYRIEPGEIESVIYRQPGVQEAAVVPVPHPEFGAILRAVIVPKKDTTLTRDEIAGHCKQHLPAYMVPSEIEFRTSLPKTATGKIDKKNL